MKGEKIVMLYFQRNNFIVSAIVCVFVMAMLSACQPGAGDDSEVIPGETDGLETETDRETKSETEPETNETHETDEPVSEYRSAAIVDGVIYDVYEDHAVIAGAYGTDVFVSEYSVFGVPVTGIVDGAFDNVSDPADVKICALEEMTFLYDYAVAKGHCFYAYYNKFNGYYYGYNTPGEPLCYVPEREIQAEEAAPLLHDLKYTMTDDSEDISRLVAEYLSVRTGYDELIRLVYFNYVCANEFVRISRYQTMSTYYKRHDDEPAVPAESRIAKKYGGIYRFYDRVRYGEIDTYDEFVEYTRLHFSNANSLDLVISVPFTNVNGQLFMYEGDGVEPSFGEYREPEISLTVTEDTIVFTTQRKVYESSASDAAFTGDYKSSHYLFVCEDGTWKWSSFDDLYDCANEYETGSYTIR